MSRVCVRAKRGGIAASIAAAVLLAGPRAAEAQAVPVTLKSISPTPAHRGVPAELAITTEVGAKCSPGVSGRYGGNWVEGLSNVAKEATTDELKWNWQVSQSEKVPVTWKITVTCYGKGGRVGRLSVDFTVEP